MFNGIIYNTGRISNILRGKNSYEIVLNSKFNFNKNEVGSSVCCNGVCLTVTKVYGDFISFYLSDETLKKTNFQFIKKGDLVNLEKSLSHGTKISGHYVQGHVDTRGKIKKILIMKARIKPAAKLLKVSLNARPTARPAAPRAAIKLVVSTPSVPRAEMTATT